MKAKKLINKLIGLVMTFALIVGSSSASFAEAGLQEAINQTAASEWVLILLGGAAVIFFLIFLLLAMVFYTVIMAKKTQHQNLNA